MKKQLGFFTVFSIASGAMISSGIFILPGLAFARTGPSVFLSYFIAGLVAMATVLSLAELGTAMPRAGGDYYFITRSFGSLLGSISGLLSWFALSLKSAFAIIGIAELLSLFFNYNLTISAMVLLLFFVGINFLGAKEAGGFQVALVAVLLTILFIFVITGFSEVKIYRFEHFLYEGAGGLFSTVGFVFVSFGGLLTTASVAEEIHHPRRNLPLGLVASIIVVTLLYTFVTFVIVGVLAPQKLSVSLAPVADTAKIILGMPGYYAVMGASLLAFVTTANGGILSASRYPLAMARDNLLPNVFTRKSKRSDTPIASVLITGAFIAIALTLELDLLVKAASAVVLLTNILANLSLIILHESELQNYRPSFRAPWYPWLQIASIGIFTVLIINMGMEPAILSILFIFAGIILYFVYGRRFSRSESALLHLIERITNRKLTSRNLEIELRELIYERDNIEIDSIDMAFKNAGVLDIKEKVDLQNVFDQASGVLFQSKACFDKNEMFRLLNEREAQSSTAITPFAAVPHVIVEGKGIFQLLLVRAQKGIYFSESASAIKAMFILVGTSDKRNLHLRALAAIAQTLQSDHFEKRWMKAKTNEDLIDLLLLSERPREA